MKALSLVLLSLFSLSAWSLPTITTLVANVPLVNQEGKPFQLYDFKGEFTFVSFIYTRCPMPKMCPLTVTLNKRLLDHWKKAKAPPPLRLLFVTFDPAFDKPAVLKRFAAKRTLDLKHVTLATGNPQVLSDFAAHLNVIGIPEGGGFSHNVKSTLLAPDMTEVKQYNDNAWSPDEVLKAMKDFSAKPH